MAMGYGANLQFERKVMSIDADVLKFSSTRKLSVVIQASPSENGLACMNMIANYYGNNIDLNQLRSEILVSSRGTTVNRLMRLAEELDFSARSVTVSTDELDKLQMPCILGWGENNFVVLSEVTKSKVVVHDPAIGVSVHSREEARNRITGIALELTPSADFEKSEKPPEVKLSSFWSKVVGLKSTLTKIFLLSIMLQVVAVATPFYIQLIVDDVLVAGDLELLVILAIGFALLMMVEILNFGVRALTIAMTGNQLNLQLSANVIQHLFKLPLRFFESRHIGDVMSRVSSLETIRTVLTTTIIEGLVDGLMIIGLLGVMFFYSTKLMLIVIGVTVLYLMVRWIYYNPYKDMKRKMIVARASQNTNLIESVRGIQTIKLYNQEVERLNLYNNYNVQACNYTMQTERLKILFVLCEKFLTGAEHVVIIYVAAKLVMEGNFSVGMIFAFLAYKSLFREKAVRLIDSYVQVKMMSLDLERLADITLTAPEENRGYLDDNFVLSGDLVLQNVSFRYSDDEDLVLKNISFKIKKGQSVAITGQSGCGKSTLVKIMLGLIPPTSGKVLVDDADITKIGLQNYRSNVACVMQSENLMAGTILQNICFFSFEPDIELIEECARKAGIHDDILAMPMGYQSLIGDMGNSLSGGQVQRIVIARALYRQPKILFMDEATSALDTDTERKVIKSLQELDMTRIFVAHRPQTIRSAERVLRVEAGEVIDVTESVLSNEYALHA